VKYNAILCFTDATQIPVPDSKEEAKLRTMMLRTLKASAVFAPVMGLTWLFGIIAVQTSSYNAAFAFTVFNCLQGAIMFIFHILLDHEVQRAFAYSVLGRGKGESEFYTSSQKPAVPLPRASSRRESRHESDIGGEKRHYFPDARMADAGSEVTLAPGSAVTKRPSYLPADAFKGLFVETEMSGTSQCRLLTYCVGLQPSHPRLSHLACYLQVFFVIATLSTT
jgi:hypothetical protein